MGRRDWIGCGVLAAATFAVHAGVLANDFIAFDDPRYVTQNPWVRAGLSLEGLRWAFTTLYKSNWHPLTWLSHMLDVELFGLAPAGHHATNLLLHVAASLLLFTLLLRLTQARGPSLLVAGLFALHPTHVESVAWIAERKDVLSTNFWLLALHAWTGWVRHGGALRYGMTLACFASGLMSKAMLVTLPVTLLLLDHWPLQRRQVDRSALRLLREKLPFFALAIAAAALAWIAQQRGSAVEPDVSAAERLANALVSYWTYIEKTLWPARLSVLVPHPYLPGGTPPGAGRIGSCALLLVALSLAVWRSRRPYLQMGWLWYLLTLVPVIGLVQAGKQAHADRYTYVPAIGLYCMAAWGLDELLRRAFADAGHRRRIHGALATVWLAALGATSLRQVAHWRDSVTLFEHSLAVAPGSPTLHNNLGTVLRERGDLDGAIRHFEHALALRPGYPLYRNNLVQGQRRRAQAAWDRGDLASARDAHRAILLHRTDSAVDWQRMGHAQLRLGESDAAIAALERASALDPADQGTRMLLEEARAARSQPR